MGKILLAGTCILLVSMQAYGMSPPVDTETTAVLPANIRTLRYKQYFVSAEEKYDETGSKQPLAKALGKSISWKDVLSQQSGIQKDLLKASLEAQSIDLNGEGPGHLTADLNAFIDVKVPIIGYGINDKHSVGLLVPVYTIKTNYKSSFVTTPTGEKWFQSISSPSTKKQIKSQLENASTNLLNSLGYKPIESESFTALGDIRFVHKMFLGKFENGSLGTHSFLWRNELVAPTGKGPDVDKLVDLTTGDGQWDFGTGLNYEYATYLKALNVPMNYALTAFYNYQFADRLERRIPIERENPLSLDKENVDRKLGDQILLGGSIGAGNGRDGSAVALGYYYQYTFATKYSGSDYASQRYSWLEDMEDKSHLESLLFLYTYSTVDKFLNKTFPVPLTWTLSYAQPINGTNVNNTRTYFTEIQFFF